MHGSTISCLIFTVLVRVSAVRPFSCSPRNITVAVDSSHCAAAPVEIISLSASRLSLRCQLMPTVVHPRFALPQCCSQMLISPFSALLFLILSHQWYAIVSSILSHTSTLISNCFNSSPWSWEKFNLGPALFSLPGFFFSCSRLKSPNIVRFCCCLAANLPLCVDAASVFEYECEKVWMCLMACSSYFVLQFNMNELHFENVIFKKGGNPRATPTPDSHPLHVLVS